MKNIRFPLARVCIGREEEEAVLKVLRSGWLTQGKVVAGLEQKISRYLSVNYGLLVNSATSALMLAVKALDLNKGAEVICPSFSFPASANAIVSAGAKPVFCDISLDTFNISPQAVEKSITAKARAIMVVSEFGMPGDMKSVMRLAEKHHLYVIEDAACSLGAKIGDKHIGTFGDIGVFSFHPRKIITSGEGGCVVTNSMRISQKIAALRNHGIVNKDFVDAGYNMRMSDIQAAVLSAQFEKTEKMIKERIKLAAYYNMLLAPLEHRGILQLPRMHDGQRHVFQSYVVLLNKDSGINRDKLRQALMNKGIGSQIGSYCIPVLDFYRRNFSAPKHVYKNSYFAYKNSLAIPLYCGLTDRDQEYIAEVLVKLTAKIKR